MGTITDKKLHIFNKPDAISLKRQKKSVKTISIFFAACASLFGSTQVKAYECSDLISSFIFMPTDAAVVNGPASSEVVVVVDGVGYSGALGQFGAEPVSGALEVIFDGPGVLGLACDPLPAGSLTGKIALLSRGTCSFATKLRNVRNAGGTGAIVVNNVSGTFGMGQDGTADQPTTVTAYMVDLALKTTLIDKGGTLTKLTTRIANTRETVDLLKESGGTRGTTDSIVLTDISGNCCGLPADLADSDIARLFPIETSITSFDNYTTGVWGQLKLDSDANKNLSSGETIQVTFGLFSDDGSQLVIEGANFHSISGGGVTLQNVGGNMALTADFLTGNTNAYGTVNLQEGQTYNFRTYHYEQGGNSNLQIFYALGDKKGVSATFPSAVFFPLVTDTTAFRALLVGLCSKSTYTVNTSDDTNDGTCDATHCSLREAITTANGKAGHDTIEFAIPGGGVQTINLASALPNITDQITIDGYTQSGASEGNSPATSALMIEISGGTLPNGTNGLRLAGGSAESTIKGLVINNSRGHDIQVDVGSSANTIRGNFLGTDPAGTVARKTATPSHFQWGIRLSSDRNTVENNLSSGHSGNNGIQVEGSQNVVRSNFLGTDATGTGRIPNSRGIHIQDGGFNTIENNILSGNSAFGIFVDGLGGNNIKGNYVGTDVTGTLPLGNDCGGCAPTENFADGIGIISGNNIVENNLVAANGRVGIIVFTGGSYNTIRGNKVGTDVTGTLALGNARDGIQLQTGNNTVEDNVISANSRIGIFVPIGIGENSLRGNKIGTDATGSQALGNAFDGIFLQTPYNTIEDNLLSANGRYGILVGSGSSSVFAFGNTLRRNKIGTGIAGFENLGNNFAGIRLSSQSGENQITDNVIAFNMSGGVTAFGTQYSNVILSNSIFGNSGLGIDLSDDGITLNDFLDIDTGANNRQNFPTLSLDSVINPSLMKVVGKLNSEPNSDYLIQAFSEEDGAGICFDLNPISDINWALASNGAVATQSTTAYDGIASRAIDGVTNGVYWNNSVTHTDDLANSFWEVVLPAAKEIAQVALYNRTDCCSNRLSNFRVTVFNGTKAAASQNFYVGAGFAATVETWTLQSPVKGNRVRVELLGLNNAGNGFLSLAEVQIFSARHYISNFCGVDSFLSAQGKHLLHSFKVRTNNKGVANFDVPMTEVNPIGRFLTTTATKLDCSVPGDHFGCKAIETSEFSEAIDARVGSDNAYEHASGAAGGDKASLDALTAFAAETEAALPSVPATPAIPGEQPANPAVPATPAEPI